MHAPPDGLPIGLHAPSADRIATRWLNLDHISAEIGEHARAEGRGDEMTKLQNA